MAPAGPTNLDTCQGDSGGPLFFKAAGPGFIQAGITSWGCKQPDRPADSVSPMWEYAIREYVQEWGEQTEDRSMATFLAELNRLGEDGWEAVGITPRTHYDRGGGPGGWDTFTFVVLLKRLRPADDMMPRS
jgi:Trypsin